MPQPATWPWPRTNARATNTCIIASDLWLLTSYSGTGAPSWSQWWSVHWRNLTGVCGLSRPAIFSQWKAARQPSCSLPGIFNKLEALIYSQEIITFRSLQHPLVVYLWLMVPSESSSWLYNMTLRIGFAQPFRPCPRAIQVLQSEGTFRVCSKSFKFVLRIPSILQKNKLYVS